MEKRLHNWTKMFVVKRDTPRPFSAWWAIGFAAFLISILLFCTEHFSAKAEQDGAVYKHHEPGIWAPNKILGYMNPANKTIHVQMMQYKKVFWNARYTLGKGGRRVTPYDNSTKRNKHLLFIGCSYTFGDLVNDRDTLPAHTAKILTEFRPYNYGVGGVRAATSSGNDVGEGLRG